MREQETRTLRVVLYATVTIPTGYTTAQTDQLLRIPKLFHPTLCAVPTTQYGIVTFGDVELSDWSTVEDSDESVCV